MSEPWTFTVTQAEVQPIISGVRDLSGPIGNGGTTTDTSLTLNGTATKNSTVEILEGGVRKGTATVDGNGNWTTTAIFFAVGAHGVTARMVGGSLVSGPWSFRVNAAILSEDFTGQPNTLITMGQSIDLASMVITLVSGGGQCGIITFPPDTAYHQGPALTVCYNNSSEDQRVRLDFKSNYRQMSFMLDYNHSASTVYYYDVQGVSVGSLVLSSSDRSANFSAPAGAHIRRLEFVGADYLFLDFFRFQV